MAKLPRPQAPARFRAVFPDLADWLEYPVDTDRRRS